MTCPGVKRFAEDISILTVPRPEMKSWSLLFVGDAKNKEIYSKKESHVYVSCNLQNCLQVHKPEPLDYVRSRENVLLCRFSSNFYCGQNNELLVQK